MIGASLEYAVTERIDLGYAIEPGSGAKIGVVATKHRRPLPGFDATDGVCFAVERTNPVSGQVDRAWGFASEADCWTFVSMVGTHGFTVPDARGQATTDERVCLGIPDGMIVRHAADVTTGLRA